MSKGSDVTLPKFHEKHFGFIANNMWCKRLKKFKKEK